ncbi:MAG: hypothetical protein AAFQ51_14495 [Pseudomonadota bacterium]
MEHRREPSRIQTCPCWREIMLQAFDGPLIGPALPTEVSLEALLDHIERPAPRPDGDPR